MKYLISSDEREAENNPLRREVAEGGIWDQEFMTHPPRTAHPCPPGCWPGPAAGAPWSSSSCSDEGSHRAPRSTAGTWGSSGRGTLCSQPEMPGNEALCQRPNAQPHITNYPNPHYSPPLSIYFCPTVLGGAKQSQNVFLMQRYIFLQWR